MGRKEDLEAAYRKANKDRDYAANRGFEGQVRRLDAERERLRKEHAAEVKRRKN